MKVVGREDVLKINNERVINIAQKKTRGKFCKFTPLCVHLFTKKELSDINRLATTYIRENKLEKLFLVLEEDELKELKEKSKKTDLSDIPESVREDLDKWDIINRSPLSDSIYSTFNIDWKDKPHESLRLSNHWNYFSKGIKRAKLKKEGRLIDKWLLCKYDKTNGTYEIVKEY